MKIILESKGQPKSKITLAAEECRIKLRPGAPMSEIRGLIRLAKLAQAEKERLGIDQTARTQPFAYNPEAGSLTFKSQQHKKILFRLELDNGNT